MQDTDAAGTGTIRRREHHEGARRRGGGGRLLAASMMALTTLISLTACSSAAPGSPPPSGSEIPSAPPTGADLAARLDTAMQEFPTLPGVVLVARGDEVLYSRASGEADRARSSPITLDTRFRIGSITKQFTAAAVLLLQQRGRLDVDDRLCDVLSACPAAWKPMTLRHLLQHTSGIPDYTELATYEPTKDEPTTPKALVARVRDEPLQFAPGSLFAYSNSNYAVLGLVIEQLSGMSYEAFLEREIFTPLGMSSTGFEKPGDGLAVGYSGGATRAAPIDMSVAYAAGGLSSTAGDLVRWSNALTGGSLLTAPVVAEMETAGIDETDSYGFGYGLGVYVGDVGGDGAALREVYHDGGIDGFAAYLGRYPDDRLTVVVLSNSEDVPTLAGIDRSLTPIVLGR